MHALGHDSFPQTCAPRASGRPVWAGASKQRRASGPLSGPRRRARPNYGAKRRGARTRARAAAASLGPAPLNLNIARCGLPLTFASPSLLQTVSILRRLIIIPFYDILYFLSRYAAVGAGLAAVYSASGSAVAVGALAALATLGLTAFEARGPKCACLRVCVCACADVRTRNPCAHVRMRMRMRMRACVCAQESVRVQAGACACACVLERARARRGEWEGGKEGGRGGRGGGGQSAKEKAGGRSRGAHSPRAWPGRPGRPGRAGPSDHRPAPFARQPPGARQCGSPHARARADRLIRALAERQPRARAQTANFVSADGNGQVTWYRWAGVKKARRCRARRSSAC